MALKRGNRCRAGRSRHSAFSTFTERALKLHYWPTWVVRADVGVEIGSTVWQTWAVRAACVWRMTAATVGQTLAVRAEFGVEIGSTFCQIRAVRDACVRRMTAATFGQPGRYGQICVWKLGPLSGKSGSYGKILALEDSHFLPDGKRGVQPGNLPTKPSL